MTPAAVHALLEAGDVAEDCGSHLTAFLWAGKPMVKAWNAATADELTRRGFVPITPSCRVFEPPPWAYQPMIEGRLSE